MKSNLIFSFILCTQLLSAQTFTETFPFILGAEGGDIAVADVDGDADLDVLVTGLVSLGDDGALSITALHINDGMGNFTEVANTPFENVAYGAIAFADVDGDSDQDVLITGDNNWGVPISKLYMNDGMGNFTEVANTPFEAVSYSIVAFSDVNSDGTPDVIISGFNNLVGQITKLYTNDGIGNFTEVTNTPFEPENRYIVFADVDGDTDSDVLMDTKLYINDGIGNFTKVTDTPFENMGSQVAFADMDGDTAPDILIGTKLYTNDGTGTFQEVISDLPFESVTDRATAIADVDGDTDLDVFISGKKSIYMEGELVSEYPISKLYINDGTGNFTELEGTSFEGMISGNLAIADMDGDDDKDILMIGGNSTYEISPLSRLYLNNGVMSSVEAERIPLNTEFSLYPNVTNASQIHIAYISQKSTWININIFDLNGRWIKQYQHHVSIGKQQFPLDISNLNQGAYIIQLDNGIRKGVHQFFVL